MTITAASVLRRLDPGNPGEPSEAWPDLRLGGVLRALWVFGCGSIEDAMLAGLARHYGQIGVITDGIGPGVCSMGDAFI
jgi:hypothetical protein